MPQQERELASWEEFEDVIDEEQKRIRREMMPGTIPLLFRGQADSEWRLRSTLERYLDPPGLERTLSVTAEAYHQFLRTNNEFDVHSGFKLGAWDAAVEQHYYYPPQGYEFLIDLRHHGFPSPLLDWTRSLHVAAYFAFNDASPNHDVAIYTFQEYGRHGKGCLEPARPNVYGCGPNVKTHHRHVRQQSQYTVCRRVEKREDAIVTYYENHEQAEFADDWNKLTKYILPSAERTKVMRRLDIMNINAFMLFGSEEGLANMLAYRELENGKLRHLLAQ